MRLSGKTALITGAAGGIGAEVARRFREECASVFACDTNREQSEKTAASIGAVFILLNATSEESWKAAFATLVERAGRLDILLFVVLTAVECQRALESSAVFPFRETNLPRIAPGSFESLNATLLVA